MSTNVNYDILNKAFDMFIEWVTDCNFGYDNIPEEYEKYKDDIERLDLVYNDGMKYIAIKEAEKLIGEHTEDVADKVKELRRINPVPIDRKELAKANAHLDPIIKENNRLLEKVGGLAKTSGLVAEIGDK